MFEKFIDRIIEKQVQNNMLKQDDVNIYRYGYILVYEVFLNIILAFVIGMVFNSLGIVLFFLYIYIPLRSFCGGWHADKIWKCTIVSNFVLILAALCVKYFTKQINILILLLLFLIFAINIICIAPVETKEKRICKEEKKVYRRKIYVIIIMHGIIITILTIFHIKNYIFVIPYAYIILVVFLFFEKMKGTMSEKLCSKK